MVVLNTERVPVTTQNMTGDNRCWPCTITNAVVGLLVAWLPLVAALAGGNGMAIAGSIVWGIGATFFTGYRLIMAGYLPMAEPVARLTGLHERIGPGSRAEDRRDTK